MRFIQQPNPYEWYFLRARDQTHTILNLVLDAYRNVINEFVNQPGPIQVVYGGDEVEVRTDFFNGLVGDLRHRYSVYKAHLCDWGFECLLNDKIKEDLEKFL